MQPGAPHHHLLQRLRQVELMALLTAAGQAPSLSGMHWKGEPRWRFGIPEKQVLRLRDNTLAPPKCIRVKSEWMGTDEMRHLCTWCA
jgi:hypothetical protein